MPVPQHHRATGVNQVTIRKLLIYIAIILTTVIGIELVIGSRNPPLETRKGRAGETRTETVNRDIDFPAIERYSEFLARPLFSQTRRPYQTTDTPSGAPGTIATPSSSELELSGISLSATQRLVLIKTKRDNAHHRVGEGEEFRGWMLEAVYPDKIVMKNGAQTQELALVRKGDPLAAKRKKESRKRRQSRSAEAQTRAKEPQKSAAQRRAHAGQGSDAPENQGSEGAEAQQEE